MYLALVIISVIVAVLLILIVLVQNSKGGGLSSEFGGAGTSQMFGVKKTTDLLEQITWGFAGAILLFSLASYVVVKGAGPSDGGINSANIEKAQSAPIPGGSIVPSLPDAASGTEAAPAAADSSGN